MAEEIHENIRIKEVITQSDKKSTCSINSTKSIKSNEDQTNEIDKVLKYLNFSGFIKQDSLTSQKWEK